MYNVLVAIVGLSLSVGVAIVGVTVGLRGGSVCDCVSVADDDIIVGVVNSANCEWVGDAMIDEGTIEEVST